MSKNKPLNNTVKIFNTDNNLLGLFSFNIFSEDIQFEKPAIWDESIFPGKCLDDEDLTLLRYYIGKIHSDEPEKSITDEACLVTAKQRSFHPIKKYLESEKWDGEPRIDTWLINAVGCKDNEYTRAVSAKILIAAVGRIYTPGCKFDNMLILEGAQAIGKSTLVEILGNDWYMDTTFNNKDKDLVDGLRGKMIIEISELHGMNKRDVDWLKSFLSRKTDRVRLPYARRTKDFPRRCIFIGTYNPSGNNMYLRDDTGNRRFWPVECNNNIDLDYVRKNIKQFWAEALVRYRNGEKMYLDSPMALEILNNLHQEREIESPYHTIIKEWIKFKSEVTMKDLIEECLQINIKGKNPKEVLSIQTIVGIIMRKLKWTKGTHDKRHTYYPSDDVKEEMPVIKEETIEGWNE